MHPGMPFLSQLVVQKTAPSPPQWFKSTGRARVDSRSPQLQGYKPACRHRHQGAAIPGPAAPCTHHNATAGVTQGLPSPRVVPSCRHPRAWEESPRPALCIGPCGPIPRPCLALPRTSDLSDHSGLGPQISQISLASDPSDGPQPCAQDIWGYADGEGYGLGAVGMVPASAPYASASSGCCTMAPGALCQGAS